MKSQMPSGERTRKLKSADVRIAVHNLKRVLKATQSGGHEAQQTVLQRIFPGTKPSPEPPPRQPAPIPAPFRPIQTSPPAPESSASPSETNPGAEPSTE